jgi:hypothetical protein
MHHGPSPSLAATLRALHGETDVHVVAPALGNWRFARIPALAPDVDPVVGALGALAGALPDLLTPDECASPALSAAIASLIGTEAGNNILKAWADVAPVGWGASHTDALIDAVRVGRCSRGAAAALIGPTNDTAALLTCPDDIAHAVRRWGQATPDDPTAWMNHVTPAELNRFLEELCSANVIAARCLPWLSAEHAARVSKYIYRSVPGYALDSYAAAPPVAHAGHAGIISSLMRHATRLDLAELTRLAAASHMDAAWTAVAHFLRDAPNYADRVVAAAPWNDVRADVQKIILSSANRDDVCAAIAFARGDRTVPPTITQATARAFFAAVTPAVWTALPAETQHAWRAKIVSSDIAVLAVRSLGLDSAFLAGGYCSNKLVAAVRRHIRDDRTQRHTLLPIAVRDLPPDAVPAVVAALPVPLDPPAFVQIAGGRPTMPPALRDWIMAHPTPQAMAAASTVLRAAARLATDPVADRCAALAQALADRSREETDALLAALPDDAHAALRFDSNALTAALAHPDRRDAFRQALDSLDALPPAATLPALLALEVLASASDPVLRRQAVCALAHVLRDHGDCFLALVDALANTLRKETFPRPRSATCVAAVRTIAAADPLAAYRLAHALRDGNAAVVLDALADSPLEKTLHLWRLLPEALQQFVRGDCDALLRDVAAPGRADALAQALRAWNEDDPPVLLALRLLIDDDARRQERGVAILAQQPDMAASLLPLLREDLRALLVRDPRIVVAGADLPPLRSPTPAPVQRRRR